MIKKEICAALLLAVILTTAIINSNHLEALTSDLQELVDITAKAAADDNWSIAEENAEKLSDKWHEMDPYTHIVLKHSEIDSTTDAIYELLKAVYSKELGEVMGATRLASEHLFSISSMEKIRFGSIF